MPGKFKRKLKQDDIFAIIANLVPVYGVWFLGWSAIDAFIVYALETLLVGFLTLLKLGVMTLSKGKDKWYNNGATTEVSGIFFMIFFTLHYGLFAAVQSTLFSQSAGITPPGSGMMHFFFHWYTYINKDIAIMLGGFLVSNIARDFIPFIATNAYKQVSMMRVMFQPYGRIFIQQLTVILGSMLLSFGWGKGFILIFALSRILFEVYFDFNKILDKTMVELEKAKGENSAEL